MSTEWSSPPTSLSFATTIQERGYVPNDNAYGAHMEPHALSARRGMLPPHDKFGTQGMPQTAYIHTSRSLWLAAKARLAVFLAMKEPSSSGSRAHVSARVHHRS